MEAEKNTAGGHSYVQIMKSMAMIGGSSFINVGFSIVRNKAMAVILGPAGIGQISLYTSIVDLSQTLAGLGVQSSGVRQIAEAVGTGDVDRIARTATALRWTSIALGLVGMLFLTVLAQPIAKMTFSDGHHTAGVVLLSLAIFFQLIAGGQIALIQGMRDIASLARVNILGGFFATVITIGFVYFLGFDGIAPSIASSAFATFVICWRFGRRTRVSRSRMSVGEVSDEIAPLLKLGFVFMVSALMMFGASYVIRLIVMAEGGMAAAGLYQAAWAIGGLYAAFILQAMGADFYPRLTAIAHDHAACNRLVNEQTQVGLLLAGPGVIATLTFAPVAMWLFYSPEFYPAADILRWTCLGMMLRITSWAMGFIMVAKGARTILLWVDIAAAAVHVTLAWLLVPLVGPVGAGMAFFGLYVWHTGVVYYFSRRLTGFSWTLVNVKLSGIFLGASGLVIAAVIWLPTWQAIGVGSLVTLIAGLYALRRLIALLPAEALPSPMRAWASKSA